MKQFRLKLFKNYQREWRPFELLLNCQHTKFIWISRYLVCSHGGCDNPCICMQGTLALIKPDAFQRRIEIEEIILKEGEIINLWEGLFFCGTLNTVFDIWRGPNELKSTNGHWSISHHPILSWGFRLVDKKRLRFTRELAEEFYQEHEDKSFFRLNRVEFM